MVRMRLGGTRPDHSQLKGKIRDMGNTPKPDPKAAANIRRILELGEESGVVTPEEKRQMQDAAEHAEKYGLDYTPES